MRPRVMTVTVSDTRTAEDDASGAALREELRTFDLQPHHIVRDEPSMLVAVLERARAEADVVVFTGGTGIAPRDQTPETLVPLFDKELLGFGEAFRRLSFDEIGPKAILSRATAGTVKGLLVFLLPGSVKAVRLGARALVVPILEHGVQLLKGTPSVRGGH